MSFLPLDIVKCVLEWVFDPDDCQWAVETRCRGLWSIEPLGSSGTGDEWIDFIWSRYAVSKCRGAKSSAPPCPCVSRVRCVFETVLRQCNDVDIIRPWCDRLKNVDVFHNNEDGKTSRTKVC